MIMSAQWCLASENRIIGLHTQASQICLLMHHHLNSFKKHLDKFWCSRDVLYDFKAPFLRTGSNDDAMWLIPDLCM